MPKKDEDLLGPIGHPGADYIRSRLKRRVLMELGITMRTNAIRTLLTCLDAKASLSRIETLHDEVLAETGSPVWLLEMEPLLIEQHGAWLTVDGFGCCNLSLREAGCETSMRPRDPTVDRASIPGFGGRLAPAFARFG